MKLPFKLPAFKLPSFGKKKTDDDDGDGEGDWDDIDLDASDAADAADAAESTDESGDAEPPAPAAEDAVAASADGAEEAPAGDEEVDPSALAALEDSMIDDSGEEDEEDKEDKEEQSAFARLRKDKKRLGAVIAAAVVGVLVLVGGGWYFFSGDEGDGQQAREESDVPRFEMAIAPKDRASESGSLNAIVENEKGPGAGLVVSATTLMAYAKIAPPKETDGPLPTLDAPELLEESQQGFLPKIAEDGRTSLQVYAKPVDSKDDRPKIAVIVTGLGLSEAATEAAISLLPGSITLAFDPYAPELQKWADKARQAGHEILIMVPLEPETFPVDDPGPQGLMTGNSAIENLLRLEHSLSRMHGYVGVLSVMGSKFNQQEVNLNSFLKNLKSRGLLFVDGSADPNSLAPALAEEMQLAKAFADVVLDTTPTKEAIDIQLANLESILRVNAAAVALIEPYPVSIERVAAWTAGMSEKNMVLSPISALSNRQFLQ